MCRACVGHTEDRLRAREIIASVVVVRLYAFTHASMHAHVYANACMRGCMCPHMHAHTRRREYMHASSMHTSDKRTCCLGAAVGNGPNGPSDFLSLTLPLTSLVRRIGDAAFALLKGSTPACVSARAHARKSEHGTRTLERALAAGTSAAAVPARCGRCRRSELLLGNIM